LPEPGISGRFFETSGGSFRVVPAGLQESKAVQRLAVRLEGLPIIGAFTVPEASSERRARLLKRGGARNRRDRTSRELTGHDCRKLIAASDKARAAGMAFNRWITVSWGKAGLSPQESVQATGEWIALLRASAYRQGYAMPWAWVQEHGPKLGPHLHGLLHVPHALAPLFSPLPSRCARKVIADRGGHYVCGVTATEKAWPVDDPEKSPDCYEAWLQRKLHYMLKCAPAPLEAELGLTGRGDARWGQRCLVYGKRAGVWQQRGGPKP
jgi:hypothetical protein